MSRKLSEGNEPVRFRVNATRCDGQGVCVLIVPEIFELDRYGDAYVAPGADAITVSDPDVRARGFEADGMCPRNAIYSQLAKAGRPAPPVEQAHTEAASVRLLLDADESPSQWRERGGFSAVSPEQVVETAQAAGLVGQGGASFPTASKLRHLAGKPNPVVVMNGAEREPGTIKDRHLMARRPALLLDGLRMAMLAIGSREGILTVDEESIGEHDSLVSSLAEAQGQGLLDGLDISLHKVPTQYVAGEETALISVISGGLVKPRLRPPYPADSGFHGRPTLVQNAETLAQLALATQLGAAEFRSVGTEANPGTGLFSVGPFGGPYTVVERPYGYSLRELLDEQDLLHGTCATLVGGYAGGVLAPETFDVALDTGALLAKGASLGTKAIQVIGPDQCPVGVVAEIVGYFGAETADQCPPCSRGLPDMAAMLRELEAGTATSASVEEVGLFMGTLYDRGVCRLPDGAARVTQSLLHNFAAEVESHIREGCPYA